MSERGRGRPPSTSHDEIRDVAFALFARRGYARTSLAEIAEAAGVSRTTLFSYFPAKRDLIWDELDERLPQAQIALGTASQRSVVDAIVLAMLTIARHDASEHDAMAARWRVVRDDAELRAHATLRWEELSDFLVRGVREAAPHADPIVLGDITRALMAVAARCTDEWSATDSVTVGLDEYLAERLAPIAASLGPLIAQTERESRRRGE